MITDEMVEVACVAAADTIAKGYHARRDGPSKRCAEREMRAALTAALPMIRDAVLEEAAKVADARATRADDKFNGVVKRARRGERNLELAAAAAAGMNHYAEAIAAAIRALKGGET
jgi:hypothetical protein